MPKGPQVLAKGVEQEYRAVGRDRPCRAVEAVRPGAQAKVTQRPRRPGVEVEPRDPASFASPCQRQGARAQVGNHQVVGGSVEACDLVAIASEQRDARLSERDE